MRGPDLGVSDLRAVIQRGQRRCRHKARLWTYGNQHFNEYDADDAASEGLAYVFVGADTWLSQERNLKLLLDGARRTYCDRLAEQVASRGVYFLDRERRRRLGATSTVHRRGEEVGRHQRDREPTFLPWDEQTEARYPGEMSVPSPHEVLEADAAEVAASLREDLLRAAVRRLTPKQKGVLVGHWWGGLTMEQLARCVGISREAVRDRIKGGEKRLATLLAE